MKNQTKRASRSAGAKPFEDPLPGYVRTHSTDQSLRMPQEAGKPRHGYAPALSLFDSPVASIAASPPPQDGLEVRTVTRYGLRLVTEGRVPYDRMIQCGEPASAARFLHEVLEGVDREVVGALHLDGRNQTIGHTIAYVGTLSSVPVEPRGVLVPALLANAAGLILFHNHPSGSPEPSRDDEEMTRRMVDAGRVVGVNVLDHIILGEAPRYLSLFQRSPW